MMIEARHYTLKPGGLTEYLRLFESEPGVLECLRPYLRGFWFTESGVLNSVHHLWAYENRAARAAARAAMAANPAMISLFGKVLPLLQAQQSSFLSGQMAEPRAGRTGGIYERLSLKFLPAMEAGQGEVWLAELEAQLGQHYEIVAALRGYLFESGSVLRDALFVLRANSFDERDRHARAVEALLAASPRKALLADCTTQVLLPAPFSAWR